MQPNKERLYYTVGPPGTGKTTTLVGNATKAAEQRGGDAVMICSLTKTAAANVKERNLPIPSNRVGTMHSHCYRMIGGATLADTKIAEFNACAKGWQLSGKKDSRSVDDFGDPVSERKTSGDSAYEDYERLRASLRPRDKWPAGVQDFAAAWEGWKQDNDYIDFADMIDIAYHDFDSPPSRVSTVYVDEAQDHSANEVRLLNKWSHHADVVFSLDPDQAIFEWRGADPNVFFDLPVLPQNRRVLEQSYRVPKAVLEYSMRWIKQVSRRDDVTYLPRDHPGEVRLDLRKKSLKNNGAILADIRRQLDDGKTVMILATCGYMLAPMLSVLRKAGIAFHNPMRTSQAAWNPLLPRKGVSAIDRVESFLSVREKGGWTAYTLHRWASAIESHPYLKRGAKKLLEKWVAEKTFDPDDLIMDTERLEKIFPSVDAASDLHLKAMNGDVDVLFTMLATRYKKSMEFALRVYNKTGQTRPEPKVTVGTIHSLKGQEADVVYISPQVAPIVYRKIGKGTIDDPTVRAFYVALTRARETVVLLGGTSEEKITWI